MGNLKTHSPATREKTKNMPGRLTSLGSAQAQGASVLKQKMPSQQVIIKDLNPHNVPTYTPLCSEQRSHVCSQPTISKSAL